MENIFFDSWQSIIRTTVVAILAYIAIVFILRITGKRTLSKMNAFDFIVTVALGSALATVALNKNVALADGVLLFFLFVVLQYIITWLSVRVKSFKKIITAKPTLLVYKGEILFDAMKEERITTEELYMAARKKGINRIEEIDAVILETTGDLTIIEVISSIESETISDVEKPHKGKF